MTLWKNSSQKPDGLILFSGFNQRSVIAMCRTLELCAISYHIVAHSQDDPIFLSKYADRVAAFRSSLTLDIEDLSHCIEVVRCGTQKRFVIAPSSEALNLFLLGHRDYLEKRGDILPLVDEKTYRLISDKASFIDKCKEYNIAAPPRITAPGRPALPVVAKPFSEMSPDGRRIYPVLIYTEQAWDQFSSSADRSLYFLQKYISGPSYYLQYYFYGSGRVDRSSMRNLVQQPDGKSIVAAEPALLHLDAAYSVFEAMLHDLGFQGLIMVELMFEEDKYYMIEANPRMWGPAQLMVDSGSNLYVSFINDLFGMDLPLGIGQTDTPLYFWWAGFWEPQLAGKPMKWHCKPSEFLGKYQEFFRAEIYHKSDTSGIFSAEARKLPIPIRGDAA